MITFGLRAFGAACALGAFAISATTACGSAGDDPGSTTGREPIFSAGSELYSLGSVVMTPDGRTTYIQVLTSLDVEKVDNRKAIEVPGNGVHLAGFGHVFVGLAEEPVIVRYKPDGDGRLRETGRLSFGAHGLSKVPFGSLLVSESKAYSVSEETHRALIWNPSTLEIEGEINLERFKREQEDTEFWTVSHHEDRLYIPVRHANWDEGQIRKRVALVIVDMKTDKIVGVAEDDRCASGGRPVFTENGDAYVMGDGRNWSAQLFARLQSVEPPKSCFLRIRAGKVVFDPDFYVEVPSVTNGYDVATELEPGGQGKGLAFAKIFDPSKLPDGVEIQEDFAFWFQPAYRYYRFELGDEIRAKPVRGLPWSSLAWEGRVLDDKLYVGEDDGSGQSDVYEVDAATNRATRLFQMEGNMYGLHRIR